MERGEEGVGDRASTGHPGSRKTMGISTLERGNNILYIKVSGDRVS